MSEGDAPEPRAFYTETLPAQFARTLRASERRAEDARRTLEGLRAGKALLRAIVGDETFWLAFEGGTLRAIEPAEAEGAPLVTLVQTREHFARLVREAGDSPLAFLGALAGLGGEIELTRGRIESLAGVEGALAFEIEGEQGFAILAHFGPGEPPSEPQVRIRVGPELYRKLRRGELDVQNAFMQGDLAIEGDAQLAMQVALAVLAPE